MRISLRSVVILALVVFISGSVLLYPSSAKSLGYPIKRIYKDVPVEPHPFFGEPGDLPIFTSGSSLETSIDQQQSALPQNDREETETVKQRLTKLFFSYLGALTGGSFQGL